MWRFPRSPCQSDDASREEDHTAPWISFARASYANERSLSPPLFSPFIPGEIRREREKEGKNGDFVLLQRVTANRWPPLLTLIKPLAANMLIQRTHPAPNTSNLIFVIRLHALFVSRRMNSSRTCVMVGYTEREGEREGLVRRVCIRWLRTWSGSRCVHLGRYARIVSDCSYCEMVREISS